MAFMLLRFPVNAQHHQTRIETNKRQKYNKGVLYYHFDLVYIYITRKDLISSGTYTSYIML